MNWHFGNVSFTNNFDRLHYKNDEAIQKMSSSRASQENGCFDACKRRHRLSRRPVKSLGIDMNSEKRCQIHWLGAGHTPATEAT